MGKLLPQFKKAVIDDIVSAITTNTAQYYGFAANPILNTGNTPVITSDDYTTTFSEEWQMIFGKKLANTDILPIINKNIWTANTIYARYDNTQDMSNGNFYVVTQPAISGGTWDIFKCIDNGGNTNPSTQIPDQLQAASFTKSDGYTWRYITSISNFDYQRFYTTNYIPVYPNTTIQASAYNYAGVEVVPIVNGGSGYNSWANGVMQGVVNSTLVQIQSNASTAQDFYTKNGIYFYNIGSATAQLRTITKYVSNIAGNWVYLDTPANTAQIVPTQTQYIISPKVVFTTDGDQDPAAYTVINPISNSIANVVIINTGYGVSWANVVFQTNTVYGSGANAYPIVPPAGGHGANPANELITQAVGFSFNFANTESNTIPQNVTYNKIGLVKSPYTISANTGVKGGLQYTGNTFTSFINANVSPATTFTVGDTVTGQTTSALGTVAFSNSSTIYITGDKYFANNEMIVSSNGSQSASLIINNRGNVYTKDMIPVYIQNINDVNRLSGRVESFKVIIQI
jgi:hypothetical protein